MTALATDNSQPATAPPWLRFTVVFVSRAGQDEGQVLGCEWIELQPHQLLDPGFLRDELRSQCERRGPGIARAKALMLEGNYHPSQACMALAAHVEIRGSSG